MGDVLTELVAKISTDATALKKGLSDAEGAAGKAAKSIGQKFDEVGHKMTSLGKSMSMKVTAPIVGLGAAAFKMSGDFDQAFRKTNVMLKASAEEAINYKKRILEISTATSKSAGDVAAAFYQIISAGYRGADSLDILETAMKGAVGGAAETESTMAALTKAMNIFNLEGVQGSTRAMDVFFGIVDTGLLSFEQMAGAFPTAASSAAGLGISIEEVGAALGTLSKVTASTDTAAMALMNAFMMLIKPSDKMLELYDEWGVKTGPEAIAKFGGFAGVLEKVKEATGGNVDQLAELFPSIRAIKAVLPLVTTNAEDYAAALDTVTNSSGRTSEAFNEMAQGPGFQLNQMITTLKNTSIRLGDTLASTISPILEMISEKAEALITWWESLDEEWQNTIIVATGFVAALGPVLWFTGQLVISLSALYKVIVAVRLITVEYTAILLALAYAIVYVATAIRTQSLPTFSDMGETLQIVGNQIKGWTSNLLPDLGDGLTDVTGKVTEGAAGFYELDKALGDSIPTINQAGVSIDRLGKSYEKAAKIMGVFNNIQELVLHGLRSVLGIGGGYPSALEGQRYMYESEQEFQEALAGMGNIYTGTGWITPQHTPQQYQEAFETYGTPEESIKGYQHGGLVENTGLAYLHAGETIIPSNESMGNVTVNFTQPVFFDREDTMNKFVDMISKGIDRKQRLRFGGAYNG